MIRKKYCAVVTGGSRGIGYSVAERLINDGVHVIVTGTSEKSDYPEGAKYYSVDFHDNDVQKIKLKKNIPGKKIKSIEVLIKVATDNQNQK